MTYLSAFMYRQISKMYRQNSEKALWGGGGGSIAPCLRSGALSFSQITPKNPIWSITILLFLADLPFWRPSFSKFSLISTRSSPPTAGSARLRSAAPRVSCRPERQPDASWQFRRLALPRSKRIKLVPEPRIFTLDRELVPEPGSIFHIAAAHTYQNLG